MELTIIHACLFLPTHSISMIKTQLPNSYNGRHSEIILSVCMDTILLTTKALSQYVLTAIACMHTTLGPDGLC